jgi:predicted Zn-dependent protease
LLPLAACVSEDREQEIGDQLASQINAHLPLVRDPVLTGSLTGLGDQLARASDRPDVPYSFYIVDTEEVNAFAIPGGHIYVNRGLIERTENAAELSAVLAHEIGHVSARHGAQMMERQLRTGSVVGLLYRIFLGREPALLENNALGIGRAVWAASHSRADELEADQLAVRTLITAGVDPVGIVTLLDGLAAEEARDRGIAAHWFSTHPMSADRLQRTRVEVRAFRGESTPDLMQDVAWYPRFLSRMRKLPPSPPAGELRHQ